MPCVLFICAILVLLQSSKHGIKEGHFRKVISLLVNVFRLAEKDCDTFLQEFDLFLDNIPVFGSMKRRKRKLERIYLKTRLEVHRQIYKNECRTYTDALNSTKSSYYKVKIADADNNQLFRTIDSLIKVKRVPLLPTHSSSKELAQRFSDFSIKDSEADGQSALVLPNIKGHVCYHQFGSLPEFFH